MYAKGTNQNPVRNQIMEYTIGTIRARWPWRDPLIAVGHQVPPFSVISRTTASFRRLCEHLDTTRSSEDDLNSVGTLAVSPRLWIKSTGEVAGTYPPRG
jgi:hypothetical protein